MNQTTFVLRKFQGRNGIQQGNQSNDMGKDLCLKPEGKMTMLEITQILSSVILPSNGEVMCVALDLSRGAELFKHFIRPHFRGFSLLG